MSIKSYLTKSVNTANVDMENSVEIETQIYETKKEAKKAKYDKKTKNELNE